MRILLFSAFYCNSADTVSLITAESVLSFSVVLLSDADYVSGSVVTGEAVGFVSNVADEDSCGTVVSEST